MIGIYKILSPLNKIYIGQSIDIERRFKEYKKYQQITSIGRKLFNSLQKYGPDNHKFEIVEECNLEQLNEREIHWGLKFNVLEDNGLNLRLGDSNGICSEETKNKIGIGNKGKLKPNAGPKRRSILQYDLEGNFIKEWDSITKAKNIFKGNIYSCVNNRQKTACGYIWKFK